jgi:hypothetical protein
MPGLSTHPLPDRLLLIANQLVPGSELSALTSPENLMAGITCSLDISSIHKPGLRSRTGSVSWMATHARSGGWRSCLPAGKKCMPVIIPTLAPSTASSSTWNYWLIMT